MRLCKHFLYFSHTSCKMNQSLFQIILRNFTTNAYSCSTLINDWINAMLAKRKRNAKSIKTQNWFTWFFLVYLNFYSIAFIFFTPDQDLLYKNHRNQTDLNEIQVSIYKIQPYIYIYGIPWNSKDSKILRKSKFIKA